MIYLADQYPWDDSPHGDRLPTQNPAAGHPVLCRLRELPQGRRRHPLARWRGEVDSLDAQNAFLRRWNRTIARLRIHGTTRRQVWTHFVEVEQPALQPLASAAFPFFTAGERTVHTDGHVEVAARSIPCRSRSSASVSACSGTRSWCASFTPTRWSRCTRASRRACLRRAPGRPTRRRASRRLSTASSGHTLRESSS